MSASFLVILFILVNSDKTWSDAKDYCISRGARLLEVRTQEQYNMAVRLRNELGFHVWIGATDIQSEGTWIWESDGQLVNLNLYWLSNRPGSTNNYDCLALSNIGFYDFLCSVPQRSVCEFP